MRDKDMDEKKAISELQEKHRRQMSDNRDKVKERKARTRRLIERGAIAESLIDGAKTMTNDEFARVIRSMVMKD